MTIRRKLIILGLLPVLLAIVTVCAAMISDRQRAEALQRHVASDAILRNVFEQSLAVDHYLHRPDPAAKKQVLDYFAALEQGLAELKMPTRQASDVVRGLFRKQLDAEELFAATAAGKEKGGNGAGGRKLLAERLAAVSRALKTGALQLKALTAVEVNERGAWQTRTLLLLVFSFTIAGVVLCYFAVSRLVQPIRRLKAGTEMVAGGDLGYRVEIDTPDEFGSLAAAFNAMTARLRQSYVSINELQNEVAERRQAEDRIGRQNVVLKGIGRILEAALSAPDEEELGKVCLTVAEEVTGSRFGFIGEIAPDGLMHHIAISDPGWAACALPEGRGHLAPPWEFQVQGLLGRVLRDGKPFFSNDPQRDPAGVGVPAGHPALTAFLGVPLTQQETVMGMIGLANRPGGYSRADVEAIGDLTAAVVQAIKRKRGERSLKESQLRLKLALEGGKMGMWEWEFRSGRQIWNRTEYQLLGVPVGDGHPSSELFFSRVHPEDLQLLKSSVERAVRLQQNWEHEFRVVRDDGEIRWLMGAARLLCDEEGKAEKMVGVNYDITERKLFEHELRLIHDTLDQRVRERTLELQASNRELESFCYSVTHELGAPLRSMNCYSAIVLEECGERLDAEGRECLARIGAASARMEQLVQDLLKLSRVTRRKLSREEVPLSELARQVVEGLRAREPEREVEVEIADGVRGNWDPALVELALQNLLGNAWKYTGKTASARIEFGVLRRGDDAVFYLRDNGIGFDMSYAQKIFLPFERLHRLGEYEGTGIGLATVDRVISMHGGRIWAEAEPGKGATFYFTGGPGV